MRLNEKNNGAAFLFEHIQSADQISTFRSKVLWRRKWQQQRHQLWGEFQQRLNREKVQSSLDQEKEMNAPAAASSMGEAFVWSVCFFFVMQLISVKYYLLLKFLWDEMCVSSPQGIGKNVYGFRQFICFTHGGFIWKDSLTKPSDKWRVTGTLRCGKVYDCFLG